MWFLYPFMGVTGASGDSHVRGNRTTCLTKEYGTLSRNLRIPESLPVLWSTEGQVMGWSVPSEEMSNERFTNEIGDELTKVTVTRMRETLQRVKVTLDFRR